LGGVAGGLGDYFRVDPVVVRLIFVLLALAEGNAVLLYLIAWLIIPEEPGEPEEQEVKVGESKEDGWGMSQDGPRDRRRLFGSLLIIAGLLFLARQVSIWIDPSWLLAIGLIAAGIVVLVRGRG
jgi:phage shock protein PspC (stress-responsive transcriptional regulator)